MSNAFDFTTPRGMLVIAAIAVGMILLCVLIHIFIFIRIRRRLRERPPTRNPVLVDLRGRAIRRDEDVATDTSSIGSRDDEDVQSPQQVDELQHETIDDTHRVEDNAIQGDDIVVRCIEDECGIELVGNNDRSMMMANNNGYEMLAQQEGANNGIGESLQCLDKALEV